MLIFGKNPHFEYYRRILKDEKDSRALSGIIELADRYGLCGNLWRAFVTYLIISDENVYTLAHERQERAGGSLTGLAERDFDELYKAFSKRFDKDSVLSIPYYPQDNDKKSLRLDIGSLVSGLLTELEACNNAAEFKRCADKFYAENGVGIFGLYPAFGLKNTDELTLKPAEHLDGVRFSDLWGYEIQKKELTENTELFINHKPANNVLLYGDSGTGKSTAVKALLNEYKDRGLRIIEVYKHQFFHVSELIDIIKNRNYFFILFMDDLSFEDFEIEYKYLKALIEGGIEPKPDNVLIYATSNRRHLIKESHSDRNDTDDRHRSDTVQEKLSLAERFGVSIFFPKPVAGEYNDIVLHLARLYKIDMPEEELLRRAHVWGMEHGRLSGRVARQFINSISD